MQRILLVESVPLELQVYIEGRLLRTTARCQGRH